MIRRPPRDQDSPWYALSSRRGLQARSQPTEGGSRNPEGPTASGPRLGSFEIQHTLGQWNVTGHAVSTKDLAGILMGIDTVDRPVLIRPGLEATI
jgi:hypothetical protein